MKFSNIQSLSLKGCREYNEDALYTTDNVLVVCDGATGVFGHHITNSGTDAAWLAHRCADVYGHLLANMTRSMSSLCTDAATLIGDEFSAYIKEEIPMDAYPSCGVCALRINGDKVEYYSLGDLSILIKHTSGQVQRIHDASIPNFDRPAINKMIELAKKNGKHVSEQGPHIRHLLQQTRQKRSKEDGYAIFDPLGISASWGLCGSFVADKISSVALFSDGADIVDTYKMCSSYDNYMIRLKTDGPTQILQELRLLENSDPYFNKYPRFKLSDDASVIFAEL